MDVIRSERAGSFARNKGNSKQLEQSKASDKARRQRRTAETCNTKGDRPRPCKEVIRSRDQDSGGHKEDGRSRAGKDTGPENSKGNPAERGVVTRHVA